MNFTVDNNIETLRNNGYDNTLEEKGQEALENHFDMRQGKAIQDYINREELMSLSLQRSTRVALDEKIRVHWLIRTSVSSEQEIAGIRIVTEGCTGLSLVKRAIQDNRFETERGSSR